MQGPHSAEELIANDGLVFLPDVITAEALLHRWSGVTDVDLAGMLKAQRLCGYWSLMKQMNSAGEVFHKCRPDARPYEHSSGSDTYYDWGSIVFKVEDVARLEKANEHFTWPRVEEDDQPHLSQAEEDAAQEWISCDTLAERWGCSPFDVIDVLKQGLRFRRSFGIGLPSIHELQEAQVHAVDLGRWELENAAKIPRGSALTREWEELRAENATLKSENAALRTQREKESGTLCGLLIDKIDGDLMPRDEALALREELRKVKAENAELRASAGVPGDTAAEQPPSPASHAKRTSAATEKASALKLQEWRAVHLPGMIKIAVFCGEDGKKPRCRSDIKAIAKKLGLQLSDAALEDLRSALPDDHKTNKPGAPRQG